LNADNVASALNVLGHDGHMLGGIGWRKTLCPRTVQTGKPCWPTKESYQNGGAVEPVVGYERFHERGVEMATSRWVARSTSGTGSVETQKRYRLPKRF